MAVGKCRACGQKTDGVEPDARRYECESCGASEVYGMEELMVMGEVESDEDFADVEERGAWLPVQRLRGSGRGLRAVRNLIAAAVERAEERIRSTAPEKVARLEKALTLSFTEFCRFQQLQAEAHAGGILTTDEAMAIYVALGGETYEGGWPEDTRLAVRVVVLQTMEELLRGWKGITLEKKG